MTAHRSIPAACLGVLWTFLLAGCPGDDKPPVQEAYAGRVDGHYLYGHDSERRLIRALRLRDASYFIIIEIVSVQPLPSRRGDDLEKALAQLAQRLSQTKR